MRCFIFSYLETSCGLSVGCQARNSAIVHYDLQPFLLSTALYASNFDSTVTNLNCVSLIKIEILLQLNVLDINLCLPCPS